jgi:hypothetical protein
MFSCFSFFKHTTYDVMNILEKESLKSAVPFEELRDIRLAVFDLHSKETETAWKAAVSLSTIVSISNCAIIIEQDAVCAVIGFLELCSSDCHLVAACDLLLAMFPYELELVQEEIIKYSGIQKLHATLKTFPNSTKKIVETLRHCVHFFNAGQNNAREVGALLSILELNKIHPDLHDTKLCIRAMCYLNSLNSLLAETFGMDLRYAFDLQDIRPAVTGDPIDSGLLQAAIQAPPVASSPSSRMTSATRSSSQIEIDSLPFEVGAQVRAIQALKESFAVKKTVTVSTESNSSALKFKKSLERSHMGSYQVRNPLLAHESSTLDDVARRILGPRRFMDVIKKADEILNKDIPETTPTSSASFGPKNHSLKTRGIISENAWASVRYVDHIPAGQLGTMYGQHPVSFLKWFYAGQMMADKANGNGVFRWVNGSQYAGQIVNNKRHGLGKMTFDASDSSMASDLCTSSGTTYLGEWENDKIHGIGVFNFHRDDGGGSLCGIFDEGRLTPYSFMEEVLPENFIETVQLEERKANALSAEAIQNASSTIFRHNYEANDGHFLFPLHYTPQPALIQRPGERGEQTTNINNSRF